MKHRVVNLFAGPGTGKSTTATDLQTHLKRRGVNSEYVSEFAKDAAWEKRSGKFFKAQQYIYGEQSWRQDRVKDEVEILVTDCPLLLGLIYTPAEFAMPSLQQTILEDFNRYDNLNIFLTRNKPYNPSGRNQNEEEAREIDQDILTMLTKHNIKTTILEYGILNPFQIIELMIREGWANDVKSLHTRPTRADLQSLIDFYYY